MGSSAANFGGLVGAFHFGNPVVKFGTALDYRKFIDQQQHLAGDTAGNAGSCPASDCWIEQQVDDPGG